MNEKLFEIAAAAVACEKSTGLPAEISVAQCALESGWLKNAPGNNCFGIKWSGEGPKQILETREWLTDYACMTFTGPGREVVRPTGRVSDLIAKREYIVRDWFAVYDTLSECFTAHARLLISGQPYKQAWADFRRHGNWETLVRAIGPTYATEPDYANIVIKIGKDEKVQAEIKRARGN